MIHIFYRYHDSKLPDDIRLHFFRKIPADIQRRINRYVRWQDRESRLFAYLLLLQGLGQYGYGLASLDNISYNSYGRPYIDDNIDFNISHSGNYTICAITDQGRVGIDIEKIHPVDLAEFRRYMTLEEWSAINATDHVLDEFFEYWTKKEGVMKAHGMGLSIPFEDILIQGNEAALYNTKYFLEELNLDLSYKCHVVADWGSFKMCIKEVRIEGESATCPDLHRSGCRPLGETLTVLISDPKKVQDKWILI